MSSTENNTTRFLKLPQIADNQDNKEERYNAMCAQFDAMLTAKLPIYIDDSNAATITQDQFVSYCIFEIEEAGVYPTGTITITVPNLNRGWFVVRNETLEIVDVIVSGQATGTTSLGSGETGHFLVKDAEVV